MKFRNHEMTDGVTSPDIERYKIMFDNGYGASVIRGEYTYGGDKGYWELAVTDANGSLTYATPITDDVIGWLSDDDVADTLDRIAALPATQPA